MAPGILEESNSLQDSASHATEPIKPTGVLDRFGYEEVTPIIGREFPTLNIVDDLINAENADELLRELAVTSTIPHFTSATQTSYMVQQTILPAMVMHKVPKVRRSITNTFYKLSLTNLQSLDAVSSSSALRTILPMSSRKSS